MLLQDIKQLVHRSVLVTVVLLTGVTHSQDFSDTTTTPEVGNATDNAESVLETIEATRDVVEREPQNSDAWYRLALMLMNQGPEARQEADRCLRKAIQIDPENMDYRIALGGLLFAKGFFYNAAEHFERLEEEDPGNARAAYWVGYYAVGEYLHEKDMRGGETPLKRYWADSDMDKAVNYLEKSIDANPQFKDSYYQLGLLALESGQPEGLLDMASKLLAVFPNDKDALLFCGLGYTSMSSFSKADSCYTLALSLMLPEERALMESVELLSPGQLDTTAFWTERNPLYLSSYNERRLEHFSRIAYANLRFSVVWKSIEGWQTDLGRSYIRFGRYVSRRTSVGGAGEWREQWSYESFSLLFKNPYGVADWSTFSFGPGARKTFEKTASRYVDPYLSVRYALPGRGVAFKRAGSGQLLYTFALPVDKLVATRDGILLDEGIFVFDENWRPLLTNKQPVILLPRSNEASDVRYLISDRTVTLPQGGAHLAIEIADKTGKSIGSFRQSLRGHFDGVLQVTEPLFAFDIEPASPDVRTVQDLAMSQNPLRTYRQGEQIHVAFEIYNLQRGSFGQTLYEVAYEIGPSQASPNADLSRSLDVSPTDPPGDAGRVTRVQAVYTGDRSDDVTYLSIDPGSLAEGAYSLKVVIRDKASNDSATVVSGFGILDTLPVARDIDSVYSVLTSVAEDVSPGDAKRAVDKLEKARAAYHDYLDNRERPDLLQRVRSDIKVIVDPGKVVRLLEDAISLNPALREAYHFYALIMMEEGEFPEAFAVCERLLARHPEDVQALLLAGLAAEYDGQLGEAAAKAKLAEEAMTIEQRATFYGFADLLSRKTTLVDAIPNRRADWILSPEWQEFWSMFWKPLDPLFLTAFNERLVNHFGRIIYSDLRFGSPNGPRGSHTDFGRAWIKLGPYLQRRTDRSGGTQWNYGDFALHFWKSRAGGDGPQNVRVDELAFKQLPPRYTDPYRDRKYSMPFQMVAFKEADSLRVELSYATLRDALRGEKGNYQFTRGIFAFDEGWRDLLTDVKDVELEWPENSKIQDRNLGEHLVGTLSLNVVPGTYHFAVEAVDRIGDRISTFRTSRSFALSKDLTVSDLLLARRIEPIREPVESRKDLQISPNPIRYFTPDVPIQFYFEMYNLVRDGFGRTHYILSYELTKPDIADLNPASFAVLSEAHRRKFEKDLSRTLAATRDRIQRVESEYAGDDPNDFTYLTIDVSQIPSGIYQLKVQVRDMTSGQTSESGTILRVGGSRRP